MPEYTLTLLIWILPLIFFELFLRKKKLLSPPKRKALNITVGVLAAVGIILDLLFARYFFTFPDKTMVIGFEITKIPIEEFIFYITGFWFIIYLYVFCDEWFLKLYNPDDRKYIEYSKRLKSLRHRIWIHHRSIWLLVSFLAVGFVVKRILNPEGWIIPGYYFFLATVAYIPMILFFRITKRYVNWRAFFFTLFTTVLISIIWEVTLAIPRGYWGYQKETMLGIFLPAWSDLPLEAVSVWIFCTLVILVYEFLKITYFTPEKSD